MRRIFIIIGACLAAAAAASAIAVGVDNAGTPGERTLTVVERWIPAADVIADVPPLSTKVLGEGDSYLFRNEVLDAGGTRLGVHEARCTVLHATPRGIGNRLICDGAYTLRNGQISTFANFTFTEPFRITFEVTGGTGAYEGARGSATLAYRPGTSRFADTTIHLLP